MSMILSGQQTLTAGPKLTVATVDQLLERCFGSGSGYPEEVTIDLRSVEFTTPYAISTLAVQTEAAFLRGQRVRFLCPNNDATLRYLAVTGFLVNVRPYAALDAPENFVRMRPARSRETYLPLTRLEDNDDVDEALRTVRNFVRRLSREGDWFKRFRSLIVELCGNVFRHARIGSGYVIAQRYMGEDGPFIELAIGDAGCGVIGSLSEKHPVLTTMEPGKALRKAVREQLSSSDNPHAGTGLSELLRTTTDQMGQLVLRSGRARVYTPRHSNRLNARTHRRSLPGTQIMVTVDSL